LEAIFAISLLFTKIKMNNFIKISICVFALISGIFLNYYVLPLSILNYSSFKVDPYYLKSLGISDVVYSLIFLNLIEDIFFKKVNIPGSIIKTMAIVASFVFLSNNFFIICTVFLLSTVLRSENISIDKIRSFLAIGIMTIAYIKKENILSGLYAVDYVLFAMSVLIMIFSVGKKSAKQKYLEFFYLMLSTLILKEIVKIYGIENYFIYIAYFTTIFLYRGNYFSFIRKSLCFLLLLLGAFGFVNLLVVFYVSFGLFILPDKLERENLEININNWKKLLINTYFILGFSCLIIQIGQFDIANYFISLLLFVVTTSFMFSLFKSIILNKALEKNINMYFATTVFILSLLSLNWGVN